jgi:hypothetical protein
MYFLTAGWHQMGFLESTLCLVASSSVFENLAAILTRNATGAPGLGFEGVVESIFFFVPRAIWPGKSTLYSSLLIAKWAGLPYYYQVAISGVGEMVARFGLAGIGGMLFYGVGAAVADRQLRTGSAAVKVGICALVLPRIWADTLMGLASVAITLFELTVFLVVVRGFLLLAGRLIRRGRPTSLSAAAPAPGPAFRLPRFSGEKA